MKKILLIAACGVGFGVTMVIILLYLIGSNIASEQNKVLVESKSLESCKSLESIGYNIMIARQQGVPYSDAYSLASSQGQDIVYLVNKAYEEPSYSTSEVIERSARRLASEAFAKCIN